MVLHSLILLLLRLSLKARLKQDLNGKLGMMQLSPSLEVELTTFQFCRTYL